MLPMTTSSAKPSSPRAPGGGAGSCDPLDDVLGVPVGEEDTGLDLHRPDPRPAGLLQAQVDRDAADRVEQRRVRAAGADATGVPLVPVLK